VSDSPRPARDLQLLDAIDAFRREPLDAEVWRVVRDGRDPVLGSPSHNRWCDGTFDVLYTSLDRDGAIAEIHALLSLQPVFPSKMQWFAHKLRISAAQTVKLADLPTLDRLGVDVERYAARDYSRTQPIAEAANFLGFDGLIAPSARWSCLNLVLFTERLAPSQIATVGRDEHPIAWDGWRRRSRR
jgi:RES domain